MHINTTTTTNSNYLQVLPSTVSVKDLVACKPLTVEAKAPVTSLSSLIDKIENLRPLDVLFSTDDDLYRTGDQIFVRAESYEHPCFKKIYHIDGQAFILVDKALIIACKQGSLRWTPPVILPQTPIQQGPYIPPPVYPQPGQWPHPGYPYPSNPSYTIWYSATQGPTNVTCGCMGNCKCK